MPYIHEVLFRGREEASPDPATFHIIVANVVDDGMGGTVRKEVLLNAKQAIAQSWRLPDVISSVNLQIQAENDLLVEQGRKKDEAYEALQAQMQELRAECNTHVAEAQATIVTLTANLNDMTARFDERGLTLTETQQALAAAQEQLEASQGECLTHIALGDQRAATLTSQLEELRGTLESAQAELAAAQKELTERGGQNDKLTVALANEQGQARTAAAEAEAELNKLTQQLATVTQQLAQNNMLRLEAEAKVKELEELVRDLGDFHRE